MLPSVPVVKMLPAITLPVILNALPAYVFDVTELAVILLLAVMLFATTLPFAFIPMLLSHALFE